MLWNECNRIRKESQIIYNFWNFNLSMSVHCVQKGTVNRIAYSCGHLKSTKSSDNGRLRREKYQKNAHSGNGRDRKDRKKCNRNTHSEYGRDGRLCKENSKKNKNCESVREFKGNARLGELSPLRSIYFC